MFGSEEACHGYGELTESDRRWVNATAALSNQALLTSGYAIERVRRRIPVGDLCELVCEGEPPGWVIPTALAVSKLLNLPENWDSYGAAALDRYKALAAIDVLINVAGDVTPAPSVAPTPSGGLQFEWHRGGIDLEFEVVSHNAVRVFFENLNTKASWEGELIGDLRPLITFIDEIS
jgi:hypothetical protein